MENKKKQECPWNLVLVICLIFFAAGAAAGITYVTMKANENFQKQLDLIWTELDYLHERDLQQEENFQYLRGALRDLELWTVEDQTRQDKLIEGTINEIQRLKKRDESHDSSISNLWTKYYDLESRVRYLECRLCSNSTVCEECGYCYDYPGGSWCDRYSCEGGCCYCRP